MNKRTLLSSTIAIATLLAGCVPSELKQTSAHRQNQLTNEIGQLSTTVDHAKPPEVYVVRDTLRLDVEPLTGKNQHYWLKHKRVGKFEARPAEPIPLSEVLTWLANEGINISAPVPGLEQLTYRGYSLKGLNAYSVLQAITATAGVDFVVNDTTQTVTIVPMAAKRYQIFLSDRKTKYQSGNALTASSAVEKNGDSSSGSDADSGDGNSSSSIETSSEFWSALTKDLEAQCEVLTRSSMPTLAFKTQVDFPQDIGQGVSPSPGSVTGSNSAPYSAATWCTVSTNPVTGFVTVQAPGWMQPQFANYIDSINKRLTTGLTFDARIYMLSTNKADSEGVDLSAFAKFADGYQLSVVNNAIGGITVAPGIAARPANSDIAGASIGITRDAQSVFLNYLQSIGKTTIKRRPIVHTSCGTPVTIADLEEEIYQLQNQQATGGENAVVATSREIITRDIGFSIQLAPTCEPTRRLIRAPFDFLQATKTGEQIFTETLTTAAGAIENTVRIPQIKRNQLTGELLIPYGGTIIIGGLQAETNQTTESGITGLRKSAFGDFFGEGRVDTTTSQVFLVLTAKVTDYGR